MKAGDGEYSYPSRLCDGIVSSVIDIIAEGRISSGRLACRGDRGVLLRGRSRNPDLASLVGS